MKYRENERRELDLRAKVIIIASIIVSFFVALVPVWQKGVTRQNHYELIIAKENSRGWRKRRRTSWHISSRMRRQTEKIQQLS